MLTSQGAEVFDPGSLMKRNASLFSLILESIKLTTFDLYVIFETSLLYLELRRGEWSDI